MIPGHESDIITTVNNPQLANALNAWCFEPTYTDLVDYINSSQKKEDASSLEKATAIKNRYPRALSFERIDGILSSLKRYSGTPTDQSPLRWSFQKIIVRIESWPEYTYHSSSLGGYVSSATKVGPTFSPSLFSFAADMGKICLERDSQDSSLLIASVSDIDKDDHFEVTYIYKKTSPPWPSGPKVTENDISAETMGATQVE